MPELEHQLNLILDGLIDVGMQRMDLLTKRSANEPSLRTDLERVELGAQLERAVALRTT